MPRAQGKRYESLDSLRAPLVSGCMVFALGAMFSGSSAGQALPADFDVNARLAVIRVVGDAFMRRERAYEAAIDGVKETIAKVERELGRAEHSRAGPREAEILFRDAEASLTNAKEAARGMRLAGARKLGSMALYMSVYRAIASDGAAFDRGSLVYHLRNTVIEAARESAREPILGAREAITEAEGAVADSAREAILELEIGAAQEAVKAAIPIAKRLIGESAEAARETIEAIEADRAELH